MNEGNIVQADGSQDGNHHANQDVSGSFGHEGIIKQKRKSYMRKK
jgi:hypothetical protein